NQSTIPEWIWTSKLFLKACLRGLFDTDGSIYVTGGKYKIVNYCSHDFTLLKDIKKALEYLGFHPYSKFANVELGRILEVKRFYKIIRPANQRHYRFENTNYAEVAKVVKARV
ncbi:MAG: LAGLIDADG family homing endonuclease, partial [Candidatus Woesebacteria bacterium]|nr:LAGLIDADG family homing endonuclease [Candidatus Woesebacteria bacterium]